MFILVVGIAKRVDDEQETRIVPREHPERVLTSRFLVLDDLDVRGRGALLSLLGLVADLCTFSQGLVSVALDG